MTDLQKNPILELGQNEETIGNRMRVVRKSLKLSQREFAKSIGVYPARVSEVETGVIPASAHMIEEVGKLGFDLNWFVMGKRDNDKSTILGNDDIAIIKLIRDIKSLKSTDVKFIAAVVADFKTVYNK